MLGLRLEHLPLRRRIRPPADLHVLRDLRREVRADILRVPRFRGILPGIQVLLERLGLLLGGVAARIEIVLDLVPGAQLRHLHLLLVERR
jgi:hypothetical protein